MIAVSSGGREFSIVMGIAVLSQATGRFYQSATLELVTHFFDYDPATGIGRVKDRNTVRTCVKYSGDNVAIAYIECDGERIWNNATIAEDMRIDAANREAERLRYIATADRFLAELRAYYPN